MSDKIFLFLIKNEVEELYKIILPNDIQNRQYDFVLSKNLFGILKKKITVNFFLGYVINYRVSYFIFNVKFIL